jgi:predicted DsbA family dithiol-disulfide isomerase
MQPVLVIPVYYDFASTLCYVTHRAMQRLAADLAVLGVELSWRALDLTLITGWPRGAPMDGARREKALRIAQELRVPARVPAVWQDSRRANAVALSLAGSDKEAVWRERVWTAIYEEGCDPADETALTRWAEDVALDRTMLMDPAWLLTLERETHRARQAGVTGLPTFMLGAWPMGGIQDDDTMRALLGRFARKAHGARLH